MFHQFHPLSCRRTCPLIWLHLKWTNSFKVGLAFENWFEQTHYFQATIHTATNDEKEYYFLLHHYSTLKTQEKHRKKTDIGMPKWSYWFLRSIWWPCLPQRIIRITMGPRNIELLLRGGLPLYCCGICCRYNEAWRWWSNFNHGWLPNATNNPKIRFLQQAQQSATISTQQFARNPCLPIIRSGQSSHHNQGLLVFLGWVHLPTEIRTWSVLRCSNYPPASRTLLGTVVAMVRNPGN